MKTTYCLMILYFLIFLIGCTKELTEEEKKTIRELKDELTITQNEIKEAEDKKDMYSGGLIKSLIIMRTEILMINEALLKQRINAIESGTDITIEIKSSQIDTIEVNKLIKEMENQQASLERTQIEADSYSGGLIKSIKLMSVATEENTYAMLRQRYLSAKYGLLLNQKLPSEDNSENDGDNITD